MSLISQIQTIVETLYPTATFKLSSELQANATAFNLETDELPFIALDNELEKDNEIKLNNNIQKSERIVMSFLNQDDDDNTGSQSQVIVDAMELIADRVISNIYQLPNVRPDGHQRYKTKPLFHVFTSNLSGVSIDISVINNITVSFCKVEPEE